eukprot:g9387.t1
MDQNSKFGFLKRLLELEVQDVVHSPNKRIKIANQEKTLPEWCNFYGMILPQSVSSVCEQLDSIELPHELLDCLPQFTELSRRVKQTRNTNPKSLNQEKIFNAFVVAKMTPDLCVLLVSNGSPKEPENGLLIQFATAVQHWTYKLLLAYTFIVSKIVFTPAFLKKDSGNSKDTAVLKDCMVGFNALLIVLDSLKNHLEQSALEQGDAALEQASSGLEQLNVWYNITFLLHKFSKVSFWLSSNCSGARGNSNATVPGVVTSKFLYSTDNLYGERVARRVRAREESRSFIGGSVRHDVAEPHALSSGGKDVRLFIDELLMVLDENSKEMLHIGAASQSPTFPPTKASSLLQIILVSRNNDGVETLNTKLCLIIYVIMDMSLQTFENIDGPDGLSRIETAFRYGKQFARYMNVEERMLDALTALWLLDCGVELTRSVALLLRPNIQLEASWPMSVIRALADHRADASDAFKYYTALQPKLRTMDDALLVIRIFLQNNLWQLAFQEQRFICSGISKEIVKSNAPTTREDVWVKGARPHDIGKTRSVLLSMIFDYFFHASMVQDTAENNVNSHMLSRLVALPLTDREERVLVQYLVQRYRADVRETIYMTLLIHYYLKRNKIKHSICIEGALHAILASIGADGSAILNRDEMKALHILLDEHLYALPPAAVSQVMEAQEAARRMGWEYFESL